MADEETRAPDKAEKEEQSPAAPVRSPVSRWRRRGIGGSMLTTGGALMVHVVGGPESLLIGAGAAAVGGAGAAVWHLPKVRHHFNDGRRASGGRRARGLRRGVPGSAVRGRPARAGSGRSGFLGRSGAKSGGTARSPFGGRAGGGTAARRSSGTGRPRAAGTGRSRAAGASPRRAPGTARSPFRRNAGAAGTGTGRKRAAGGRAGTGTPRRRGTGTTGSSRRRWPSPGGSRRGTSRPGAPGTRRPGSRGGGSVTGGSRRRAAGGARGKGSARGASRPGSTSRPRGNGRRGPWGVLGGRRTMPPPRGKARTPRGASRPGSSRRGGTGSPRARRPGTGGRAGGSAGTRRVFFRRPAQGSAAAAGKGRGTRAKQAGPKPVRPFRPSFPRVRAAGRRYRKARVRTVHAARRVRNSPRRQSAVRTAGRVFRRAAGPSRRIRGFPRAAALGFAALIPASLLFWRKKKRPAGKTGVPYAMVIHPPKARPDPADSRMPRPAPAGHSEPRPAFGGRPRPLQPTASGGNRTMTSPIHDAAEAIAEGFANFKPSNIEDLRGMFDDLPQLFENFVEGVNALANRFDDELPVKPVVGEGIREMVAGLAGLRDHSDALRTTFEQAHESELKRIDEPRPGEELWDVQNNR